MPHANVGRTFHRVDASVLKAWNPSNDVFERLAKMIHVKDRTCIRVGSSFATNGYEVHVVVERWDYVWRKRNASSEEKR